MRKFWVSAILGLLLAVTAFAALPFTGVVKFDGLPLPGATITATPATPAGKALTAVSGLDGTFTFADLPSGVWSFEVAMTGFAPLKKDITVAPEPAANAAASEFTLTMLPYSGPPVSNTPPAAVNAKAATNAKNKTAPPAQAGFNRTDLAASASAGGAAQAPAPESAANSFAAGDPNRTAADAMAVNGSMNNGAASPFAQAQAFGNNRRNIRSLYNGSLGFVVDDSVLDASPFSITGEQTPKPAFDHVTTMLSFGGPLAIPHLVSVRSAPQIVVSFQDLRSRTDTNQDGLVPTVAQRGGEFSTPITDPSTGQSLGDQIPGADISPQATALLKLYPLPNVTGDPSFNYQIPTVGQTRQDSLQVRINKALDRKDQISGSVGLQSTRTTTPNLFDFADGSASLGSNTTVNWRRSFTQRFYGTATFQYSRQAIQLTPFFANQTNIAGNAGITGGNQSPLYWGPPTLNFSSGIQSLSDGEASHNRNQTTASSYSGYWNHGNHNVSFGGDFKRLEFNYLSETDPRGTFTFTGAASGDDFADFLLGVPDTSSLAFGNADKYFRQSVSDLWVGDDFRLSSSITLNLGLRWDYAAPMTELYGRLVNLDIASGFTSAAPVLGSAPVGAVTGETYPSSLVRPDRAGPEPQLGLAWRPFAASSLVVHAGYGLRYNTSVYQGIAALMSQQSPLSKSLSVANGPADPLTLANGFNASPATTPDTFAVDPNFRIGYVQSWKADMQRDLPASLVMKLGYAGIEGTHAMQAILPNTYPVGGVSACPACPVGFTYLTSNGTSSYEAGTAQLQRRFRSGFAATALYTYSKAIDDAARLGGGGSGLPPAAQNWLDPAAERSLSSFDQRQQLSYTMQYSTGVGLKGGTLLKGWQGAAYKNWTLLATLAASSGMPLTPETFAVVPGTGLTEDIRPSLTGAAITAPPTGLYINPAAYTTPVAGQWGDAGRDSITGPGQFTLNAGMQRSFAVNDRINAAFRFDATNVLNHVSFPTWNTIYGSAQFGLPSNANVMRSLQATIRFTF